MHKPAANAFVQYLKIIPLLLIAAFINMQPIQAPFLPIVLSFLITLSFTPYLPTSLLWIISVCADVLLGMPLGFHGIFLMSAILIGSRLSMLSSGVVWLIASVLSMLSILSLTLIGLSIATPQLLLGLLGAMGISLLTLWFIEP